MIHWKLLHRVYLTPMKRFYMNLSSSPKCNLCSQGVLGTFCIFFGSAPLSHLFWTQLSQDLSYLLGTEICLTPRHFFMNDFWDFTLSVQQRPLLLAALTVGLCIGKNLAIRYVSRYRGCDTIYCDTVSKAIYWDISYFRNRIYILGKLSLRAHHYMQTLEINKYIKIV